MTFEQLEKRLLKNKKFREISAKSESEYQLTRSKIAARIDKSLIHSGFNVNYPTPFHKQLFRAILAAKNERELAAFFGSRDFFGPKYEWYSKNFYHFPAAVMKICVTP